MTNSKAMYSEIFTPCPRLTKVRGVVRLPQV